MEVTLEGEIRDDGAVKSVWRKPTPPLAVDLAADSAEGARMEAAVMGSESWPALKDAADAKSAPATKITADSSQSAPVPMQVSGCYLFSVLSDSSPKLSL